MSQREISSTLKNLKFMQRQLKERIKLRIKRRRNLKLNEAAGDVCQRESTDACAPDSANPRGRKSSRENGSSIDGAECSKTNSNGGLKRKQSEVSFESQDRSKSPKSEGGQHSSANSSKGTFKRPKHDKLDSSALRRKKSKQLR